MQQYLVQRGKESLVWSDLRVNKTVDNCGILIPTDQPACGPPLGHNAPLGFISR